MTRKRWIEGGVLLGVVALCLVWWGLSRPAGQGATAEVWYDGTLAMTLSLSEDGRYTLAEDPTVCFQVEDGKVRFVDATCPDKVCEETGWLEKAGEMAVCLPRKTRLVVGGESDGPDVIAR